ncbi:acyl-CoA N-acyltransferase [Cylindrobasidium torrendii FP15055 ss-10]|uniref:Acyl-CoA N-acyltransferase n=1 Tax=Cylindrobasidium torrendii FP15055 ss-10 TaxID=1314674 RepID=A0A0D7BCC7_9AGAR|nr:acyl-CoA N-acyltransferase [Cylindrobasidium torrendii FP15055 ss-10]
MASRFPKTLTSPTGRCTFTLPEDDSSDDHHVARLRTHPAVRQHLPQLVASMDVEDAARLREARHADPAYADYHIHVGGNFAGNAGIKKVDWLHKSAEGGILILPEFQGKGLATEAFYAVLTFGFEELKLNRICFETASENAQMRGWFDKVAGATLEGILRGCWGDVLDSDRFVDVATYSILKKEWPDVKKRLQVKMKL